MAERKSIQQLHLQPGDVVHREVVSVLTRAGELVVSHPRLTSLSIRDCRAIEQQLQHLQEKLTNRIEALRDAEQQDRLYSRRRRALPAEEVGGEEEDIPL